MTNLKLFNLGKEPGKLLNPHQQMKIYYQFGSYPWNKTSSL